MSFRAAILLVWYILKELFTSVNIVNFHKKVGEKILLNIATIVKKKKNETQAGKRLTPWLTRQCGSAICA